MGQPERVSTEACKANATPELEGWQCGNQTRMCDSNINVAVLQDTKDFQALSCITNPEVPGKLQQSGEGPAETMLRRYRPGHESAIK